ncbi:TPA: biliverdin-producing heme oxygenase [Legionella pneumophila]|uniref:biliverdin-producing heme oxygenase n=1 Tax=Legionella pneumophila TaxID=446 RepID=UPI00058B4953|nr:biliverdin-producing heme oxygenase [Legionella pneumophila]HAT9272668.1 heme oxygenase [Legionella pneumophila subsp. pneumophila]MCO1452311.1 biliverdin-producing heme oxygenase [Legionella pneumophila]MCZ4722656.1 biliverdin-producing heme oxygenase [Legionella pneumophila]MCZ4729413.1 biliverdin-producing heme oxygenase [Legionella pneumophila]MCZ4734452.1 biliverdin-producing heme oxygenase [Legionella pneumophila]
MFSKALISATYKNGKPGQLTEEHEKAEHHRFKTEFLFKNAEISKELYASRLIQHFFIIKAIETKLQSLSKTEQSEISAFFAISYLEHLWRSPAIENDLRQLNINPDEIDKDEITKTTENYLENIGKFTPKILLAHFLLHIAGFMHGGNIIRSKYIEPSNRLTSYQIAADQYDFSSAISFLPSGRHSPLALYQDMMKQIDNIALTDGEYDEILEQCKGIYETMSNIYDDLCDMHAHHLKLPTYSLAAISVSLVALGLILKLLMDFLNPVTNPIANAPR